jgi:hypothetical protein
MDRPLDLFQGMPARAKIDLLPGGKQHGTSFPDVIFTICEYWEVRTTAYACHDQRISRHVFGP